MSNIVHDIYYVLYHIATCGTTRANSFVGARDSYVVRDSYIYIICLTWSVTHICHIATCDTIRDNSFLKFLFECIISFFGHICHTTRAANNTPPPWGQITTYTPTRNHHSPKIYYPRPCSWHSTYYPTATLLPAPLPPSPSLRSKAFSQSAYSSTGAHSQKSDTQPEWVTSRMNEIGDVPRCICYIWMRVAMCLDGSVTYEFIGVR